jgi:hypothetical protein
MDKNKNLQPKSGANSKKSVNKLDQSIYFTNNLYSFIIYNY